MKRAFFIMSEGKNFFGKQKGSCRRMEKINFIPSIFKIDQPH
jgi:hypothetical protein